MLVFAQKERVAISRWQVATSVNPAKDAQSQNSCLSTSCCSMRMQDLPGAWQDERPLCSSKCHCTDFATVRCARRVALGAAGAQVRLGRAGRAARVALH